MVKAFECCRALAGKTGGAIRVCLEFSLVTFFVSRQRK
jgi:hypothetical protein